MDTGQISLLKRGLPSSDVRTIFEDSKHVLWIATSGGLAILSNGKLDVLQNLPDSLREQIFGIAEDKEGFLWIATSDHVLQSESRPPPCGHPGCDRISGATECTDGLQGCRGSPSRSLGSCGFTRPNMGFVESRSGRGRSPELPSATPYRSWFESNRYRQAVRRSVFRTPPKIAAGSQSITFNYVGTSLSAPGESGFVTSSTVPIRSGAPSSHRGRSCTLTSGPAPTVSAWLHPMARELWNGPETTFPFSLSRHSGRPGGFDFCVYRACVLAIIAIYRLRMYQLTQQLNVLFSGAACRAYSDRAGTA